MLRNEHEWDGNTVRGRRRAEGRPPKCLVLGDVSRSKQFFHRLERPIVESNAAVHAEVRLLFSSFVTLISAEFSGRHLSTGSLRNRHSTPIV
jgi:uncharacterized protein with von Willebrand factor type A (vWA) domain